LALDLAPALELVSQVEPTMDPIGAMVDFFKKIGLK